MPGVIGASIFSPRPARGYRFHSLQVEIISCSYSLERRNHFQYAVRRRRFVPRSECLTTKIVPQNQPIANWPGGHRPGRPIHRRLRQIFQFSRVRRDLTSGPAAITSARPRGCNKSLLLAGRGGSGEDRALQKNKREVTPCKIKPRSISSCV